MHSNEEILFRTILIASVTIGIIIALFILLIIRQHREYRLLNVLKIKDEINTLENERKRMAEDIHDGLGPMLTATKLRLESLDSFSATEQPEMEQCIRYIEDIIIKVRQISNGLLPNTLVRLGIVPALTEFIAVINKASELEINFCARNIPALAGSGGIHVFRILQEIIHNTIKHANAYHLQIEMFSEKKKLVILTADDGCGFRYYKGRNMGSGLDNLHNRTEMLNGEINLRSSPGAGTFYYIELPL